MANYEDKSTLKIQRLANQDRIVEPETISKNGASLKSQTSRGNQRITNFNMKKLSLIQLCVVVSSQRETNAQSTPADLCGQACPKWCSGTTSEISSVGNVMMMAHKS